MTRGILKNVQSDAPYRGEDKGLVNVEPMDRKKVIENTRLNAQMSNGPIQRPAGMTADVNEEDMAGGIPHLQWDEGNLLVNEMEKTPKMKIDEPKTPYEGGFDPNNDYYKELDSIDGLDAGVDDNDMEVDQLDVVHSKPTPKQTAQLEVKEEEQLSDFERKRRMHYHTEGNPLHQKPILDEDEEEDEDQ